MFNNLPNVPAQPPPLPPPENRAVYEIMRTNSAEPDRPKMKIRLASIAF